MEDPQFYRYEDRLTKVTVIVGDHETWRERGCPTENREENRTHLIPVESLAAAQLLSFICPKCKDHHVHVSLEDRGVLDHQGTRNAQGLPSRWRVVGGTGLHDLSLQPSIFLSTSCGWHGYVTNGKAE